MSLKHAAKLTQIFTPTYALLINAQFVSPAPSRVIKPNELQSALLRPLQTSTYEPHRSPAYLAASLSYGIVRGHPFLDGNKRTGFFLANEYLRAHGLPGLVYGLDVDQPVEELIEMAESQIGIAAGQNDLDHYLQSARPLSRTEKSIQSFFDSI